MTLERTIFEIEKDVDFDDPDELPIDIPEKDRRVYTQPYDLVVESLVAQITAKTISLKPLSERPKFQRGYVWSNKFASRLIESILLNVPIPPCYLSQNDDFELDVIDGQQRLYSIYRFLNNEFTLQGLEVLKELNGLRFHKTPSRMQRQIGTHTLRCIIITNESHPEIKFDVFQRLNSNTMPLNSQELRNCIYRGGFNDMLHDASEYKPWLAILNRKAPANRLRDEEIILRFFAFNIKGLSSYRTPQKHWLNDFAKSAMTFNEAKNSDLLNIWRQTINVALLIFTPDECFRRSGSKSVNKALFDIISRTCSKLSAEKAVEIRADFRRIFFDMIESNDEFNDLISRAVDHTKRTKRRFEIWENCISELIS